MRGLGGLWEGLGRLLGHLGGVFGAPWGSGSRLGSVLGRLGPSWTVLCENDALVSAKRAVLKLKRVPRWGHFGSPSGAKSESKTMIKMKPKKDALEDRLGPILGRFGGSHGVIFGNFIWET